MDSSNHFGFLLYRIGVLVDRHADKVLFKEFGIGFSQFRILLAIQLNPGDPQKDIANYLAQTEASVSRQIKLLTTSGHVSISKNNRDKKLKQLNLTVLGEEVVNTSLELLNRHFEPLLAQIPERDRTNMLMNLSQIELSLS